jgi:starch phosphorylase
MKMQLLNNDLEDTYREALEDIGYDLDMLYEDEVDFNLGSGLCGRIVGEYLDSLATLNIPSWGYGLRYEYGLFQQDLGQTGEVNEVPTQWLEKGNPWEIERAEIIYKVNMGGEIKMNNVNKQFEWIHEDTVQAMAYDIPITGFNTFNTNNLRLWRSRPNFEQNQDSEGDGEDDLVDKIDKI